MGAISSSLEMYDKIKEKIERITPLLNATDNYINQSSKLALMNDGLQTQSQLQDKIYQSAQRSRSSYDGLANSVAELGLRNASAFKSNDETIAFAELMNKSFKISGASISQSSDYMSQLTQAMTDGSIQGGEFESMMENAPMLAQAVGKYTGKSIGDLQDMSSKGELTANIIKNSLFNAADEINGKFSTMPMTFGDIWVGIKNKAINNFSGIMQKINDFINTDAATSIINNITNSILSLGSVLGWIVDGIISVSTFFSNNWSIIEPIIWGIVAAVIAYNASLIITNILNGEGAIAMTAKTIASWAETAAILALILAQDGLNAALLACPLTWIIVIIIAVIAAIIAWSAHTYGLQATWLMFTNFLITAFDTLKICAFMAVYGIMNMFDSLGVAVYQLSVNIQNALGDMKAEGLMILQSFVNGAIGYINDLINHVNKIPGVSIKTIDKVTFGTEAMAENEAEKAGRNKDLAAYMSQKDAAKKAREDSLKNMVNKLDADIAKRQSKINAVKEAHANGNDNKFNLNNILGGAGSDLDKWNKVQGPGQLANGPGQLANGLDSDSKKRLENIDDKIDVSNEHLEVMRDLAEMESIQNFVTLTPTVQVTTGDIKEEADINKIISKIETYMENELANSAEGVYA